MPREIEINEDHFIVSKTDTKGIITYFNKDFLEVSGFKHEDLLYKNHNILRHEDMPSVLFKYMWTELSQGNEVNAYVKNKTKSGDFYWVFANITPSFSDNNRINGYFSVRKKAQREKVRKVEEVYRSLRSIEHSSGVDAAHEHFKKLLKGNSYDKFVLSI